MLRDVSKRGSRDYLADGFGLYAELTRQPESQLASICAASYLAHLIDGQLRASVATLARHVAKVIRVASQKEMRRIAARAVVACVADELPKRNRAVRQLVSNAVRPALFAPVLHRSISGAAESSRPGPALIWISLVNALPKPESDGDWLGRHRSIVPLRFA